MTTRKAAARMAETAPAERAPVLAFAYEVLATDLIVDTWENTSREVAEDGVEVTAREVTITFTDGTTETTTQRPGRQTIYEVQRLVSLLPEPESTSWVDGEPPAEP